jgi:hypothetical protein
MVVSQKSWRKWHRWVGFAAAPFLLFAAVTGIAAGVAEMTGEDEEAREAARDRVSDVRLPASAAAVSDPVAKALANVKADGAPAANGWMDGWRDTPAVGRPDGTRQRLNG